MGACLSTVEELLLGTDDPAAGTHSAGGGGGGGGVAVAEAGRLPAPVHPNLPDGAERHPVRNVYDGDTLTLVNEKRVRFLGIDTPEIKEKQPFAEEAKAYTKERCHKRDIWLTFEPGHDREDRYGRLLAWVWVPAEDGDGYLCVNEGIVHAGLATVYTPKKSERPHNMDEMIKMQSGARKSKRGMWESWEDYAVVKTANGSAFHVRECEHLANSRNLTDMKASDALDEGLHPCRTCLADK